MAFNLGRAIRVLLVDQDKEAIVCTAAMLALKFHQVTTAASAYAAMKTITDGNKQFDVVIADVDLPNTDGYKLCQEITKMGTLVLLTSAGEGPDLVQKALESGAALLIQKPADKFISQYLLQFVMKERMINNRANSVNLISDGVRLREHDVSGDGNETRNDMKRENVKDGGDDNNMAHKRVYTKWDKELSQKFMDAVTHLGEESLGPKAIHETMNVPGLTRMQVASHLQKCRRRNWMSPEEYKNRGRKCESSTATKRKAKKRVLGSMPTEELIPSQHVENAALEDDHQNKEM